MLDLQENQLFNPAKQPEIIQGDPLKVVSEYTSSGEQPHAIKELVEGLKSCLLYTSDAADE